jgi:acyl-CoA synthetase (AMP-forming)/AMP-acid ligase II
VLSSSWRSLRPYPEEPAWADLRRGAEHFPNKIALIDASGTRSTYRDLWDGARRVAALLQREAHLAPGETVALGAMATRELVVAMYGAFLAGARVTTFNARLKERELLAQLTDANAVVALAPAPLWWTIEQLAVLRELHDVRWIRALEDIWALQERERHEPEAVVIDPRRDVALLPYSSGTSGMPKGVMLTHANLAASSRQLAATGWVGHDSVVMTLRLFSNLIRLVFAQGATAIAQSWLETGETLAMLGANHATHLMVRPTYLRQLARRALSSPQAAPTLRVVETGGEPLPPSTASLAERAFHCPVVQAYHLTETGGAANRVPLGEVNAASVGCPVPDTEERIVIPGTDADVATGEVGEVLIRGPQVAVGYWNQVDATAATFGPDGWMRTGDLARQDARGHLVIVGRMKEMLKVGGMPVAPAEVEAALLEHSAVADAVVVPMRSSRYGEVPRAYVVLRAGHEVSGAALIAHAANRLAEHKRLQRVDVVTELPQGPGGKVRRSGLRSRDRAAPADVQQTHEHGDPV